MSWDLSSEEVICNKLESQQTTIFAFSKKIKALEAKNIELENQLKLSNEFVDIWRDKAIELEKKLESVEMVHSNYVNVSCDLYSTLEKKLEAANNTLKMAWKELENSEHCKYANEAYRIIDKAIKGDS